MYNYNTRHKQYPISCGKQQCFWLKYCSNLSNSPWHQLISLEGKKKLNSVKYIWVWYFIIVDNVLFMFLLVRKDDCHSHTLYNRHLKSSLTPSHSCTIGLNAWTRQSKLKVGFEQSGLQVGLCSLLKDKLNWSLVHNVFLVKWSDGPSVTS